MSHERELIDEHLSNEDQEQALQYLRAEYAGTLQTLRQELAQLEAQLQTVNSAERIYRRIAGVSWAYRSSRRRLRTWIHEAADNRTLQILAVCPVHSLLLGILEPVSGLHIHLTPESVADGALRMLPKAGPDFDICLVELIDLEGPRAMELLGVVAGHLKQPGTILVHWHDQGTVPLQSVHSQIVQFTLDRGCHASAHYAGSWASAKALRTFQEARHTPAWRRLFPLACLGALALFAELRERFRKKRVKTIPKYCSSAAFHIEAPSLEGVNSDAALKGVKVQKPIPTKAQPRGRRTQLAARERKREPTSIASVSEERVGGKL